VNRIASPFESREGPFLLNSRPVLSSTATKIRLNGRFPALRNPLALYSLQAPSFFPPAFFGLSATLTKLGR